jgi:AraC-like DNA-binding protein
MTGGIEVGASDSVDEQLATFPALRTRDVAEAEAVVSQVYAPHRLTSGIGLDVRLNVSRGRRVTLGWLRYGAEAWLAVPPMHNAYHLNLTLTGTTVVRQGHAETRTVAGRGGALLSPVELSTVTWSPDAEQFALKLDRCALETQLSALLHDAVTRPLAFSLGVDLRSSAGAALLSAAHFVAGQRQLGGHVDDLATRELESFLLTAVLLAVPHAYSGRLVAPGGSLRRYALDEAIEYIEAHPDRPLDAAKLAAVAGTTAAELGAAFRSELGTTLTEYVRSVRLTHARQELRDADVGVSVAVVARRWGFRDIGRFAAAYEARYGEPPRVAKPAQT